MITTRNRLDDLRRTCWALMRLDPPPREVLITADGCTDDTVEFVRQQLLKEFPSPDPFTEREGKAPFSVRLFINEQGKGSVASRDRMMREATGELVLALDDDSYPEQPDCIARIAEIFRARPGLAILHFPQRTDEYPQTLTQSDFGPERPTRSFANSGAVLRRSVYMQLPGFEPSFFHMYEEPDYALQCVAAGYEVLFSPAVTIRHHYSAQARSELRNHHRHARNEFWSTLMRCPLPYLPGVLAYRVGSQFRYACKRGVNWVVREPLWWFAAVAGAVRCLRKRKPVSWQAYRQWLRLP